MRLGINPNGGFRPYGATIYNDLFHQMGGFGPAGSNPGPMPPLRTDGLPEFVKPATCNPSAIFAQEQWLPGGDFVIHADGVGTIAFTLSSTPASKTQVVTFDGSGKPAILPNPAGKPAPGQGRLTIRGSDPDDPLRNIRVIIPGGDVGMFRKEYLADLQGFTVLRHLGSRAVNGDLAVTWDDYLKKQVFASNHLRDGMPFEDLCELSHVTGAAPWFCIPYHADDSYIEGMARLIDARLCRSLPIYIEFSNELWNSGFEQYHAARAVQAKVVPFAEYLADIHGRLAAAAVNTFKAALSPGRKCIRVVSAQAANIGDGKRTVLKAMASGGVDALAAGPYFGYFNKTAIVPVRGLAAKFAAGDSTAMDKFWPLVHATIDEQFATTAKWVALAKSVGLPFLLYECGQHLVPGSDAALKTMYIAANRDPRMGEAYTRYLDGMEAAGVDLACLYSSHATPGKDGSWGIYEWVGQPIDQAPKAAAVRAWMARRS